MRLAKQLVIFAGLFVCLGCQTTLRPDSPPVIHTLVLLCEPEHGHTFKSRLGIIHSDEIHDYGLTTAHGVTGASTCEVSDDGYSTRAVLDIGVSPGFSLDVPETLFEDWAIVKFPKIDRPGLVRFSRDTFIEDVESLESAMIPRGRGLLFNEKSCNITMRDARVPPIGKVIAYPTHDCRTQVGQSGTPLVATSDDGQQFLVGILTGRTFFYDNWEGEGPGWYGRFVPLTESRVDAITVQLEALLDQN